MTEFSGGHDIEAESEGDGDLAGVEREVANRSGETVGGGQMERVDGAEGMATTEFGGPVEAASIEGNDVDPFPIVLDRSA